MAIYDRDYILNPQRRTMWGGFSVTTWIIIVNIAIFVLGAFTGNSGLPRFVERRQMLSDKDMATVDQRGLVYEKGYREVVLNDRGIGPRMDNFVSAETTRKVGNQVFRLKVDPSTNLWVYADRFLVEPPLHKWGHFSTSTLLQGEIWRLITFQFLHAGVAHVVFNMLGLWVFGRITEQGIGSARRYLAFYLICGIFGALMYLLLNLLGIIAATFGYTNIPGLLPGNATMPLVGASAGVFGVIMAAAYLQPQTQLQLLFPPIPIKIKTLAYGYVCLAIITVLFNWNNAGGEAAHLGGAFAGYFFIRRSHLLKDFFVEFTDLADRIKSLFGGTRKPRLRLTDIGPGRSGGGAGGAGSVQTQNNAKPRPKSFRDMDPKLESEVDRILAKSNATGIDSLTPDELATLKRGTDLMNRLRRD